MSHVATGAHLKAARRVTELTVADASARFGVSCSTLTRWESGKHLPATSVLRDYLARIGAPSAEIERPDERGPRPSLRVLRAKRRRANLTLQEIGLLTGLSLATLHRYETGEREPDPATLRSVAAAYGCSQAEQEALACGGHGPGPVIDPFLKADAAAQVGLYARLETIVSAPEPCTGDQLLESIHGLLIMGDHRGLLEVWELLKPVASRIAFSPDQRAIIGLSVALARFTVGGNRTEARSRIQHWRNRSDLPLMAVSHLTRLASSLRDFDEAEAWQSRLSDFILKEDFEEHRVLCELNAAALKFLCEPSRRMLHGVEELRLSAIGPLQHYTLNVAEAWMHASLGNASNASKLDSECRMSERTYGYGSPLVFRVRTGLNRA